MKFYAQNSSFTEAMKEYVLNNEKQHLQKYADISEGVCKFKVEHDTAFKVEIEYSALRLRASYTGETFYEAVDEVIDRLVSQLKKMKEKKERKTVLNNFEAGYVEPETSVFNKEKLFYLTEMSDEEAIDEMEMLGHNFFVYKDKYNGNDVDLVSVVYKRSDGTYGVIRCR